MQAARAHCAARETAGLTSCSGPVCSFFRQTRYAGMRDGIDKS